MLWVPRSGRERIITNGGIVGDATPGTDVPHPAVANNVGTVTELISSSANDQESWGLEIFVRNAGATTNDSALNILIGGATDDVLIQSLLCGTGPTSNVYAGIVGFFFPVHIPQGKRLAASLASIRTTGSGSVIVRLYGGSPPPFRIGRKVTTYGTQINNSRGQSVSVTASGGTAAVTELTSGTSEDHFAFIPSFNVSDSTMTARVYAIGIGVGAATEERIGTWWFHTAADEWKFGPQPPFPSWRDVPAGTRLTFLASNSGANDAAYDGLIYAVS